MKKTFYIGIVIFLLSMLTACSVSVKSAVAFTNIRDNNGNSYICDNFTTELTYEFTYTGTLDSWRSFLKGASTGVETGHEQFFPNSSGVTINEERVTVTYIIPPFTAPLNIDSNEVTPQAIVVIPKPQIIGATNLHLIIRGGDGREQAFTNYDPFEVIDNCQ